MKGVRLIAAALCALLVLAVPVMADGWELSGVVDPNDTPAMEQPAEPSKEPESAPSTEPPQEPTGDGAGNNAGDAVGTDGAGKESSGSSSWDDDIWNWSANGSPNVAPPSEKQQELGRCVLSLRDPADKKKYHDDDAMWNHAENALREVLTELGIHFTEEIGEAAFYGPKLDVNVKPAVGAEYTLSTCQLDFCLPAKFHLTYVDKDGTEKTPVVLHRAILGSLDRFMAYLIEETKGKFPTWLAPVQVKVLPVSEKTLEYSEAITEKLVEAGIRVALDDDNQKIGYKIRAAQQVDRVPYMLVLGAKEAEAGNVSVRDRKGETTTMEVDEFIAKVTSEIKNRSL